MADGFAAAIAPHLVVGLAGTRLAAAERELLAAAPPAGIIVYPRNVESPGQLADLAGEASAAAAGAGVPALLVCADHEGGAVSALARAIGAPPSAMAVWRPRDPLLLGEAVRETALQIKRCGINFVLAPVADINTDPLNPIIGTRAFGETAESVAEAVGEAVRALAAGGLLTCLKHFPGHGATGADSHLTLPVIDAGVRDLATRELLPFAAGIEAGADAVMTAHVALRGASGPASLDRALIGGVLRGELGFEGVVITDALEMAGVLPDRLPMCSVDPHSAKTDAPRMGPAAVVAAALEAGNDLLLMSRPLAEVSREMREAEDLLGRDPFWRERFAVLSAAARERIEALRSRAARPAASAASRPAAGVTPDAAASVALRAVSLSAGRAAGRSAGPSAGPRVFGPVFVATRDEFEQYALRRFAARLCRLLEPAVRGPGSAAGACESDPDVDAWFARGRLEPLRGFAADPGSASGRFLVLRPEGRAGLGEAASRLIVLLSRLPMPAEAVAALAAGAGVVVAAGRPWDAALVPQGIPVITTYGVYDQAALAVARILQGLIMNN